MAKPSFIYKYFPDDVSLGEARRWAYENSEAGCLCPVCKSKLRVYRRVFSYAMAVVLREIYRRTEPSEYLRLSPVLDELKGTPHQGGYGTYSWHWGLIEVQEGERKDGSKRVGWWRVTPRGRQFVRGEITVPNAAYVFKGNTLFFSDEQTTMSKALKEPFDYRDL